MEAVVWGAVALLAFVWLGVVFVGPPYVPTLKRDLDQLFAALQLSSRHRLVDLGAGDGRVLVRAAQAGAKVAGVEINPLLTWLANFRLRRTGNRVTAGNMWQYALPQDTTHVFVFPAGQFMERLERYCAHQATQVGPFTLICYGFALPGKKAEKVVGAFNLYRF